MKLFISSVIVATSLFNTTTSTHAAEMDPSLRAKRSGIIENIEVWNYNKAYPSLSSMREELQNLSTKMSLLQTSFDALSAGTDSFGGNFAAATTYATTESDLGVAGQEHAPILYALMKKFDADSLQQCLDQVSGLNSLVRSVQGMKTSFESAMASTFPGINLDQLTAAAAVPAQQPAASTSADSAAAPAVPAQQPVILVSADTVTPAQQPVVSTTSDTTAASTSTDTVVASGS